MTEGCRSATTYCDAYTEFLLAEINTHILCKQHKLPVRRDALRSAGYVGEHVEAEAVAFTHTVTPNLPTCARCAPNAPISVEMTLS